MKNELKEWVSRVPKAELHLHIEGSLEPELMMSLALKHGVELPYSSIEEVRSAYDFHNLQSFLDLYYFGASVLRDEDDFYQLMYAYLQKCREDNVVHAEIMFDPQTHTQRNIGFEVFMPGFARAIKQAEKEWGQSCLLIMSFLRHLSEESAMQTLEEARHYLAMITAVGLDSSELGNPPEKFERVFAKARAYGLKRVAHAGEEGPPAYVWGATKSLAVDRIDHGVRSIEDAELVAHLVKQQIPLTVCPLSNTKLKVFGHMTEHNILQLLEHGLVATVNADDPSYFGGYLNDNYFALIDHLPIEKSHLVQLVKNSFSASFLPEKVKQSWLAKII
ncbi:MAG: adenosine deaminase [Paraglaciecola sp.]|uniref:adenosine deaminase n=1 Tax=Paraglaciecola sp. TaxID=1920173 RepID=UPI00273E81C8|nr:adenosine deaminase [Paraglaciecola sp.]MDP5028989.1 adenosine deaminase [Paraglaciecola sp.]MDP5130323.1 adenosine deaminase [Paraglaciecola sp.]